MNDLIAKAAVAIDDAERTRLYNDFQKLAGEDVPLVHVAEFTFITVARDSVRNVANNPRWATSHWADTWLAS
jgi:peptide/nickel transport system substrate-binding protein